MVFHSVGGGQSPFLSQPLIQTMARINRTQPTWGTISSGPGYSTIPGREECARANFRWHLEPSPIYTEEVVKRLGPLRWGQKIAPWSKELELELAGRESGGSRSLRVKGQHNTRDVVLRSALQGDLNEMFSPPLRVGELLRTLLQVVVRDVIGQAVRCE